MVTLAAHTGLGDAMDRVRAGFDARLAASTDAAIADLARAGRLRAGFDGRPLGLPRPFADMLAAALALDEHDAPERAETLRRHYLDLMPRMRVEQLGSTAPPAATFLGAPLDWPALPSLAAALSALSALLVEAGAPDTPAAARAGAGTVGELYRRTFYGGFMPLLYGYPADLAHFARALPAAKLSTVIDRYLAAPLIHELAHLGRDRSASPLYLDECVAAYLGVRALRTFAYPRPGDDNGVFATPWFAQVGQALVRAVGLGPVLRAHAGVVSWDDALPHGLAGALVRLGWDDYLEHRYLHFLSDNLRPDPWMKQMFLSAAGDTAARTLAELAALPWAEVPCGDEARLDGEILGDALAAMCLDNHQVERSFRTSTRPPPGAIAVDLAACRVSAPGGPFDPAGLAYLFPPSTAARLRARGLAGYTLELDGLDGLDEAARAISDGAASRSGPGYRLARR